MTFTSDKIIGTIDWQSTNDLPSTNTKTHKEMLTELGQGNLLPGVYLICHKEDVDSIGEAIIHDSVGYTGKGKDVIKRTNSIKAPLGAHPVRAYRTQQGWDPEEVYIKYLLTKTEKDAHDLEKEIHAEYKTLRKSEQPHGWAEASLGGDGHILRVRDSLNKCNTTELKQLIPEIKQMIMEKIVTETQFEVDEL